MNLGAGFQRTTIGAAFTLQHDGDNAYMLAESFFKNAKISNCLDMDDRAPQDNAKVTSTTSLNMN